ncbi:MAG: hypothetical protein WC799_12550 [Desulfobacteraceae bacterium]|jgi:hypothetical protein
MTSQTKIKMVHGICWLGAAADAFWTVVFLHPPLFAFLTGKSHMQFDINLRLMMGGAASLMAGWTLLLIWTAKKPIERRMVMLFTAVPVLVGLIATTVTGIVNGNSSSIWILVKCGLLTIIMLVGYQTARTTAAEDNHAVKN